jgi:hypothetical protein
MLVFPDLLRSVRGRGYPSGICRLMRNRDYFAHSSVMSSQFGLGGLECASPVLATLLNSTSVIHRYAAQEIENRKIYRHRSPLVIVRVLKR